MAFPEPTMSARVARGPAPVKVLPGLREISCTAAPSDSFRLKHASYKKYLCSVMPRRKKSLLSLKRPHAARRLAATPSQHLPRPEDLMFNVICPP